MPSQTRNEENKKRANQRHKTDVEDERGWAGQRGQRPANEEEKNYRPHEHSKSKPQ